MYGQSLLIAVAVAVANFAAIRLFYVNKDKSKKDASKLSGLTDTDMPESHEYLEEIRVETKQMSTVNRIGDPCNLYEEMTEEFFFLVVDAEKGHSCDIKPDILPHTLALKCKETTVIAKISEESHSEVLSSCSNDNGFTQIEEKVLTEPPIIANDVHVLKQDEVAIDKLELLFRGGLDGSMIRPEEPNVMAEPSSNHNCTEISHDVEFNNDVEVELHVSSFNGLSEYLREDISSFYKEAQSGVSSISPLKGTSTISPYRPFSGNNGVSHPLSLNNLKGAEESPNSFSHATESLVEKVPDAFYKEASESRKGEYVKARGFSRERRLVHHTADKNLSTLPQPIGVHVKNTRDPSDWLSTYNHLLRARRLTDCIELLERMEKNGLLDMDKVYHARFFKACKSKKAVKEAFSFIKLIKKPTLSTFNMLLSVSACSQDSEGPFQVLRLVKEAGLKADCKLYTTLISTCAKNGKVDAMFEVFHKMVNAGVEPNVLTYGALIDGCARAGQVAKAFGAYGILRSKKVKPDRVIFNALITACGHSGAVDRAFDVLAEMRAEAQPIDPDHVTIGALIETCAQAGQVDRAREVYKMIHQYNIKGTPEVYTIAVNSCSEAGDIEFALAVYSDMRRNGVIPDEMFFSALIDVAGHAGKLNVAFEILEDAKSQGIRLGHISYSSLMGACSNAKNWQKALELYEEFKVINLIPTVSTVNALITSLCEGAQLQKAVEVLAETKEVGVYPNDVTYSILLVACEKKDELELGFELVSQAKVDGVIPNPIMCKCLTGLCLRRFEKASSLGEPILSFNSGKPQIENKWTSWALMVYRETVAAGVVPSEDIFSRVLGCLRLPRDTSLRSRLIENLGVSSDASRSSNLFALLDGFGEYDPRSFSLLEEAASLGIIPCLSFRESPIIVDTRKLQIHTTEVYLLTVLKGLKHRLAAGAKLPNITVLLPVQKTCIFSPEGERTVNLVGRNGRAVGALLRRLRVYYQGKESAGKIRISGLTLKRWLQPKHTKLMSRFGGKAAELGASPTNLAKGISDQQRDIRTSNLSI